MKRFAIAVVLAVFSLFVTSVATARASSKGSKPSHHSTSHNHSSSHNHSTSHHSNGHDSKNHHQTSSRYDHSQHFDRGSKAKHDRPSNDRQMPNGAGAAGTDGESPSAG